MKSVFAGLEGLCTRYPLLSPGEEAYLAAKAAAGDEDAVAKLYCHNARRMMKFARKLSAPYGGARPQRENARKPCSWEISLDEAACVMSVALWRAIKTFDPSRPCKELEGKTVRFSSWANLLMGHAVATEVRSLQSQKARHLHGILQEKYDEDAPAGRPLDEGGNSVEGTVARERLWEIVDGLPGDHARAIRAYVGATSDRERVEREEAWLLAIAYLKECCSTEELEGLRDAICPTGSPGQSKRHSPAQPQCGPAWLLSPPSSAGGAPADRTRETERHPRRLRSRARGQRVRRDAAG